MNYGNMQWSREQIWSTLFQMWSVPCLANGLVTASRSVVHYINVDHALMPAAYQFQKGESWKRVRGLPPAIVLKGEILLYADSPIPNPQVPQSTILNTMLDIIQSTLGDASPDNNQTLQNTPGIQHVWIEDNVQIYEGVLVNTSIVIIPIHILVGSNAAT